MKASDKRFLKTVDHLKIYILLLAASVLLYLIWFVFQNTEMQMATTVLGIVLCAMFWLTQRLLSFISLLDTELARAMNILKNTLSDEKMRSFFSQSEDPPELEQSTPPSK
ncbi:MAG: hypothetical protein MN733_34410 [Nitrososphaera sp.]|nr:hypothetical protein [Nitrososphaera sp.]